MTYTRSEDKNKALLLQSATAEQIQQHTEDIIQGLASCYLPPCPRCQLASDLFKRHEKRSRQFYVVMNQLVVTLMGLLLRWKCPGCNKTMTEYPGFAIPYKRYTLPTILGFSSSYVANPDSSYRGLIDACPLEHETKPDAEVCCASMMEHSTIHRWVTTLGGYSQIAREALNLILQTDPITSLCRDLAGLMIPSKKYTSNLRKKALLSCFRLVFLESIYQSVFPVSIFPRLATRCGYS